MIIIGIIGIGEYVYSPRVETTAKHVYIFYGNKQRKYFKLW
jgi:hypothetical protein